jgi:hypothetical protein
MNNSNPILFGELLSHLIITPINEGYILNQSFNEQKEIIKPLQFEFKEHLETYIVDENDIYEKLSCAICQDIFHLNEKIIKLPCNCMPHFFHKENTEECQGILPWFEAHNTCPVCREEYPSEPVLTESEQIQSPESFTTVDITITPEQLVELNIDGSPDINVGERGHPNTADIYNVLRMLFDSNHGEENHGEENHGEDNHGEENRTGNMIDEMLRRIEEEYFQAILIQSMSER